MVDDNYAIIQVGDSVSMYAPVLAFVSRFPLTCSTLNKDLLKPGCSVCVHPGSSAVVDILPPQADNDIKIMTEKPTVTRTSVVSTSKSRSCASLSSCRCCTPRSSPKLVSILRAVSAMLMMRDA